MSISRLIVIVGRPVLRRHLFEVKVTQINSSKSLRCEPKAKDGQLSAPASFHLNVVYFWRSLPPKQMEFLSLEA